MSFEGKTEALASQGVQVYRGGEVVVANGANLGDALSDASDLILDDVYHLAPEARRWRLSLAAAEGRPYLTVSEGSQLGAVDAEVHLDCSATFMAPDGTIIEAMVLVELERGQNLIASVYLLPLRDLRPRTDYALVSVDIDNVRNRFASLACVSFTRGTKITMGNGEQRAVEDLRVGERVLTRDNGVQTIRWLGEQTLRATGAFAPILITKGAMNNANDLILSPNQRLFIYQREDRLGMGRPEVMVKAELLVNGETVVRGTGGFVDYFQILFDNHEFIYAEGIATESMIIDARTSPALPKDVQSKLGLTGGRRRARRGPVAADLDEGMLDSAIAADILRRASSL